MFKGVSSQCYLVNFLAEKNKRKKEKKEKKTNVKISIWSLQICVKMMCCMMIYICTLNVLYIMIKAFLDYLFIQ